MKPLFSALGLLLPALAFGPRVATAAAGELDCTFGSGGRTILQQPSLNPAYDAALDSQGRIITFSAGGGALRLSRFLVDGRPDPAFGSGGSIVHTFSGPVWTAGLALDSQDRILVGGRHESAAEDTAVARFLADGSLDTSFGTAGLTVFDASPAQFERVMAIAVDAQDRPVLGGTVDPNGMIWSPSNADLMVLRFTTAGAPDPDFDGDGVAFASSPGTLDDDVRALAIDGAGRIVVAGAHGASPRRTVVARFTAAGAPDPSFDADGVLLLDASLAGTDNFGEDLVIDAMDRAVVLASVGDDPTLVRLLDSGALDTSFSGDGIVQRSFFGGQDVTERVLVQADGRLLVTGWPVSGFSFRFASMRFDADGTPDLGWGSAGVSSFAMRSNGRAYAALLQPDQKLLMLGGLDNDTWFGMARLLNDGHAGPATQTTISAVSGNPSGLGLPVTVSYQVVGVPAGTPGGNVVVSDGVDSCSASVAAGQCTLTLGTVGARALSASYAGDGCYAGSNSGEVAHDVRYVVTPVAGSGGSISPATPQLVAPGGVSGYSITPDPGFVVQSVTGCGGSYSPPFYFTAPVAANCSISASFAAAPVAVADPATFAGVEDVTLSGTLSGTATAPRTFALVASPQRGELTITDAATGSFTYAPDPDSNGADSFSFTVSGGGVTSAPAVVDLSIAPVNDAPALTLSTLPAYAPGSSGERSIPGFAGFDAGPSDEDASQSPGYLVTAVADPDAILVDGDIAISPDGTLQFRLAGHGGRATVTVRVGDGGGSANGGIELSPPQDFSIEVESGADLQVQKDNGVAQLRDGQAVVYAILVANAGPDAVSGARLVDALPATLIAGEWTCIASASSAPCPAVASGSGDLDVAFDLAAGSHLRFDVGATVAGAAGTHVLNTASVTLPAGVEALDPQNDSATDSDPIVPDAIFADGFETRAGTLSVPAAIEAWRRRD